MHRPVAIYTASVFFPKDTVAVRLFNQADAMDTAQDHFPAVSRLEGLQIQSRGEEQSFDVCSDQEDVAGGVATAVGAAHTGKTQPPVEKRNSFIYCSVDWSFEGKDRSLLSGSSEGTDAFGRIAPCGHPDKKNLLHDGEGLLGREGFEPSKAAPTDLQSAPFDHSGTSPFVAGTLTDTRHTCQYARNRRTGRRRARGITPVRNTRRRSVADPYW